MYVCILVFGGGLESNVKVAVVRKFLIAFRLNRD